MITIGITTCNRMKYTKSLLKSLGDEILLDNQVIIVDNGSKEKGFKEFLKKESKRIGALYFCRSVEERDWVNDEYIAKNIIIENSSNDIILFLQDDQQFLFDKETLDHVVHCFSLTDVPSLDVNAVRTSTILNNTKNQRVEINLKDNKEILWLTKNNHFPTMGFFKKDIFDTCGLYPVDWPKQKEFWGRSETWYAKKIFEYNRKKLNHNIVNLKLHIPLFATVWNDPRGGYAFIREEYRYGFYLDPEDETYYKNRSFKEYLSFLKKSEKPPYSYPEIVKCLGWNFHKDENGDQIKYPQSKAMETGPKVKIGEEE